LYRRLRLSYPRTRRPSPLRIGFLRAARAICHSRGLPTQRRRRSDPNGTSPTRSRRCADGSSSHSPEPFPGALAAMHQSARRPESLTTDAVRLGRPGTRGIDRDRLCTRVCVGRGSQPFTLSRRERPAIMASEEDAIAGTCQNLSSGPRLGFLSCRDGNETLSSSSVGLTICSRCSNVCLGFLQRSVREAI